MEVKYNNTAGRLLAIFLEAREHQDREATHGVWRDVLNLPAVTGNKLRPEEVAQVYGHLVPMLAGLDEIEEEIGQERPEAARLYVKNFVSLRIALTPTNLTGQWQATKVHISDVALHQLELCANELPKEGTVPQAELDQISEAVNKLFDEVRSSDLENALKHWILELLSAIKKSIDNYHIFGAKGLRTTFSMLIGEFTLYSEALKEVKERDATIYERLGNMFHSVHSVMMKAKQWLPLLKEGAKVLQLPFDDGGGNDIVN